MRFASNFRRIAWYGQLAGLGIGLSMVLAGCERKTNSPLPGSHGQTQADAGLRNPSAVKGPPPAATAAVSAAATAAPVAASDDLDTLASGVEHQRSDWLLQTAAPPATSLQLREEAMEVAEQMVQRFPDSPDALEVKARFLLLFGESQRAKECWQQALRIAPDYAYALHGLGQVALREGRYEEAIDWLQRSLPKQPAVAEPVHDLADAYTKLGRLDEAIDTLQTFVQSHPQFTLSWLLLGQAHQAKQNYAEAEQAFRTALKLVPQTARAQQGLATVLLRLGKRAEAQQILAELRSQKVDGSQNRLAEQVLQDEMQEVAKRFQGAAELYAAHGDLENAARVAQRAVVLDPQNLQLKSLLGKIYQQQGRLSEAIEVVRELQQAEPTNASWPFTLGVLQAHSGKWEAASQQYQEVIRLAPQNPLGYEALARLSIGQGMAGQKIIELAQQAVRLRGTAADHELLAQAYAVNAKYAEAEQALQAALRLDPENPLYQQALQQLRQVWDERNE